eukprot:gene26460-35118_t
MERFGSSNTPNFVVLKNPTIRSTKNSAKVLAPKCEHSFPVGGGGGVGGENYFTESEKLSSPQKKPEVEFRKSFKSEVKYIDPISWMSQSNEVSADLDVCLGKYQVNGESTFWKTWKSLSVSEQVSLCIKIRVNFGDLELSGAKFYVIEKSSNDHMKDSTAHSISQPELSTQNKSYSLKLKNVFADLCFEVGIKAVKANIINIRSVRISYYIEKSAREFNFDRPLPLQVELNSVFNSTEWYQRQLLNFQRFHRKIKQFIYTSYGNLSSEEYMRRCQGKACIRCRKRSEVDPTFPVYCLDDECAGNIIDSDYRSMAYLEPFTRGLVGEEAGRALEKKVKFNWSRWLRRDHKYRLKMDKSIVKVEAMFYEACVENKLFCPTCGQTEPYLDVWFRNHAARRGKLYYSKCQTCWKHFVEPDVSFDLERFELRMKKRDKKRAEELAGIAARLESDKGAFHPYQFIDKLEEKWRRENPTSDGNWAPNNLLNKSLPNYRLKLVESNNDMLELSDFTGSDFDDRMLFETSLSTLSAEDFGDDVEDAGLALAVDELSVKEIIDLNKGSKEEIIIVADDAFVNIEGTPVIDSLPKVEHILKLPCDCALCRKIAMRKVAREQSPVSISADKEQSLGKPAQELTGTTAAMSPIHPKAEFPTNRKNVEEPPKRKSNLRPFTAVEPSSSRLVEQLRGNISRQRAVSFNSPMEMNDSITSSGMLPPLNAVTAAICSTTVSTTVSASSRIEPEPDGMPKRKGKVRPVDTASSPMNDDLPDSRLESPIVEKIVLEQTIVESEINRMITSSTGSPRHNTKSSPTLDLSSTDLNDDSGLEGINKSMSLLDDSRFNLSMSPRSVNSTDIEKKKSKEVKVHSSDVKPTISVQIAPISRRFQDDRSLSGLVGVLENYIPNEEHIHQRHELWLRGVAGIVPAGALRNAFSEFVETKEIAHTNSSQSLSLLRRDGFGPINGSHTVRVSFVYNEKMRTITAYNPVMHIGVSKLLYTNNNVQESPQQGADAVEHMQSTDRMVYFVGCCNSGSREQAYFFLSPLYSKSFPSSTGDQRSKGFQYFQRADVSMTKSDRCEYLLEKTSLDPDVSDHLIRNAKAKHNRPRTPVATRNDPYVSYDWKSATPLTLSGKKTKAASLPGNVFFVMNIVQHLEESAAVTVVVEYHFTVRCLAETELILHGTFLCHQYFSSEDIVQKRHLDFSSSPVDLQQHAYFVIDGVQHTQRLSDGVEFLCATFQS